MAGAEAWVVVVLALVAAVGAVEEALAEYQGLSEDYPHLIDVYDEDVAGGIYNVHDYDYSDIITIRGASLAKCYCKGGQVWDNAGCSGNNTIVAVEDLEYHTREVFSTTDFGNVTVTGLPSCSAPSQLIKLDSNKQAYFSLLINGSLIWQYVVYDDYCIEHTPGDAWVAYVCVPPPAVPTCCHQGFVLTEHNTCERGSAGPFTPPAIIETEEVVTWEVKQAGPVNMTCLPSEDLVTLVLDNANVSLRHQHLQLVLSWHPMESKIVYEEKFCLAVNAKQSYVAQLCYKDPVKYHRETCQNSTCVRKCCPEGYYHGGLCQPASSEDQLWHPSFHQYNGSELVDAEAPSDLQYVVGYPLCPEFFGMEPHKNEDDKFYLLSNGFLYLPSFNVHYSPERYCIDHFEMDGTILELPLVCFQPPEEASVVCQAMLSYLYPALLVVSCIFLVLTLFMYVSVPELHAKVHGKCLVSHVIALLMAYCSLITVQWATDKLPIVACRIMASITHISFLAAFFWLNVMCFDIWWTLKSMRPVAETGERSRFRFKMYSLYSWGCPLLIAIVSITMQYLPEDIDVIRPGFGNSKCWFDNNTSLWVYFYGFVLVLVIVNIIFFCQVAYILVMAQNDPILQRTRQQNRERMWLYVKLFLVMGITWLAEVISWQEGSCEAWVITDIINSLQGFSIFLIFVCKRNMIRKVRGKWEPYLRRMKEVVGSTRISTSATPNVSQDNSSFSSSVNRQSQSAASRRTVESQISLDPSTVSRKLSTSSISAGIQVHAPSKIPMSTLSETDAGKPNLLESTDIANGKTTVYSVSCDPHRLSSSSSEGSIDETTDKVKVTDGVIVGEPLYKKKKVAATLSNIIEDCELDADNEQKVNNRERMKDTKNLTLPDEESKSVVISDVPILDCMTSNYPTTECDENNQTPVTVNGKVSLNGGDSCDVNGAHIESNKDDYLPNSDIVAIQNEENGDWRHVKSPSEILSNDYEDKPVDV